MLGVIWIIPYRGEGWAKSVWGTYSMIHCMQLLPECAQQFSPSKRHDCSSLHENWAQKCIISQRDFETITTRCFSNPCAFLQRRGAALDSAGICGRKRRYKSIFVCVIELLYCTFQRQIKLIVVVPTQISLWNELANQVSVITKGKTKSSLGNRKSRRTERKIFISLDRWQLFITILATHSVYLVRCHCIVHCLFWIHNALSRCELKNNKFYSHVAKILTPMNFRNLIKKNYNKKNTGVMKKRV